MISIYKWDRVKKSGKYLQPSELENMSEIMQSEEHFFWIDLNQPSEEEEKLVLERCFPIHPLTFLDITQRHREEEDRGHLPKAEEFPEYLFVIVNPLRTDFIQTVSQAIFSREEPLSPVGQLSAVITDTTLITHHSEPQPSVKSLHSAMGKFPQLTQRGPDYLFHIILDSIIDQFAPLLDHLQDRIELLEDQILNDPIQSMLTELLCLKRILYMLRKTLGYERELLAKLTNGEFELVNEHDRVYYRNVYDHIRRSTEMLERYREMVHDLQNIHLSATSNKLNQIMKTLAMISTVLMPMSLVAGIYGMNFDAMPETKWHLGYPLSIGLMLLSGISSFIYFRWRKWI